MKHTIVIIGSLLLLIGCTQNRTTAQQQISTDSISTTSIAISNDSTINVDESFTDFFTRFSRDSLFQHSRSIDKIKGFGFYCEDFIDKYNSYPVLISNLDEEYIWEKDEALSNFRFSINEHARYNWKFTINALNDSVTEVITNSHYNHYHFIFLKIDKIWYFSATFFSNYNDDFIEQHIKSDTLSVISTDIFILHPFGMFSDINKFINKFKEYNPDIKLKYVKSGHIYVTEITTSNNRILALNNIDPEFKDETDSKVYIVNSIILDTIPLKRDICIGISKPDLIKKLKLGTSKFDISDINVIELVSGVSQAWLYFSFVNDTLTHIEIKSNCIPQTYDDFDIN